jgi:urease accessory protein
MSTATVTTRVTSTVIEHPPLSPDPHALLRLCHLVSPALPVGAYAYSQGLEFAVHAGWVHDEASALAWLRGVSARAIGTLDLPILARLYAAWTAGDAPAVLRWNAQLLASRETAELRAEDLHLGRSLARVLTELQLSEAQPWFEADVSFATLFALAASRWHIALKDTLGGYLWTWTENQVLAAVRLVPLGQSAGQRLLHQLIEPMPALCDRAAQLTDDEIGNSAVSQTLAGSLHESQYSRLFRS